MNAHFLKIADSLGWFVTEDGKWNVMPNIYADGERYRVNYCPSCGQNVRDIVLPVENDTTERRVRNPDKRS